MARSERGGSGFLLCFGLFVVVSCSFGNCASLLGLKALRQFQGQIQGNVLQHGRLLIGQSSLQGAEPKGAGAAQVALDVESDYQSDMVWETPTHPTAWGGDVSRLGSDSRAVERILKLEPQVECTGDSMQLQVRNAASTPGSLFFVDRGGQLSPLPVSKVPPRCGFTFRPTSESLVFMVPYDGCFVTHEGDSYVLPLRWFGLAVRMSCPITRQSSPKPPMVTCHTEGMIVKTKWTIPAAEINVKLNGSWEPLMKASSSCGFSVAVDPEGMVIAVHYAPCLEEKDGIYTLELTGDGESKISCPSLSASHPEPAGSSYPHPEDHYPHSEPHWPARPGLPPSPGTFPGKPRDMVAPTTGPKPQLPYYPFPFYVPLPTPPPVTQAAAHPEHHEPNPFSPYVFYNQPLVDEAFFNEPHREHSFYQDPFHSGFTATDHHPMPMPLKQETFASSWHSQASPHHEGPSASDHHLEQVTAPSGNGENPESVVQHQSSGGAVPPDAALFPALRCPRVCPPGFSNCCPQMAFHQYLHLVPAGVGSERAGFGSSWASAHHQNPSEPLTVQTRSGSTSAPTSLQPEAPENGHEYLQPPDGVHAAQGRKHHNELPDDFYNLPVPDPFHPFPYNVPVKPWAPGYNSFQPYVRGSNQRHDQQFPMNTHNPPGHNFMYNVVQNQPQRQNNPPAWYLQPPHSQPMEFPELDLFHVPDYPSHEAQAPTYKIPSVPNSLQTPLNAVKDHMARGQTVHSHTEPKNVPLHRGPPAWKPRSWSDSQLPYKKLVHDPNFVAQNLLGFSREHYQRPSWER